jgi:hypothetical protein
MSAPDYKVVRADDWAGIYINGDLYFEGHSIPDDVWMNLLDEELVDRKVDRSDVESAHAYEVIQGYGRCPAHWPEDD